MCTSSTGPSKALIASMIATEVKEKPAGLMMMASASCPRRLDPGRRSRPHGSIDGRRSSGPSFSACASQFSLICGKRSRAVDVRLAHPQQVEIRSIQVVTRFMARPFVRITPQPFSQASGWEAPETILDTTKD